MCETNDRFHVKRTKLTNSKRHQEVCIIKKRIKLVDFAHSKIKCALNPGDVCIDATAGNGHDSLFLAKNIAPSGKVLAIDIQETALSETENRLNNHGLSHLLETRKGSHTDISKFIIKEMQGKVAAVMFNLGYLPGGDHEVVTKLETTTSALVQAYDVIREGGLISVLCYRGHEGGKEEALAVVKLCKIKKWSTEIFSGNESSISPKLVLISKT